jgi:hypothetical protein
VFLNFVCSIVRILFVLLFVVLSILVFIYCLPVLLFVIRSNVRFIVHSPLLVKTNTLASAEHPT